MAQPQTSAGNLTRAQNAVAAGQRHTRSMMTQIILYVQQTGSEPPLEGTTVEIKGGVEIWGSATQSYPVDVSLRQNTNFETENNGLGKMIWRAVIPTLNDPPNFRAHLHEEGVHGQRAILNRNITWGQTDNKHIWGFWWWFDSSQDQSFKAFLAWSVDDLPM
ncbi:hypothetical protein H2198_004722 [Neophaeococcomyces mojaviensis]|uniref:Uncharacterized protein n=1 Tax=Neophaeococcomyces mojaviensis TaxID=3383035 RepID=A0ACC3A7V8_9EURO|nr:hypothetical protein H2198_004722 [Knufia sp. JES_112]